MVCLVFLVFLVFLVYLVGEKSLSSHRRVYPVGG